MASLKSYFNWPAYLCYQEYLVVPRVHGKLGRGAKNHGFFLFLSLFASSILSSFRDYTPPPLSGGGDIKATLI